MESHESIRLPQLLLRMIESGRWAQPSDGAIRRAVPWLQGPVDFVLTEDAMRHRSAMAVETILGDRNLDERNRWCRGDRIESRDLPWLDPETALFVAINRQIGDDLAIVLDYREIGDNPRVVASHWGNDGCSWVEVARTFSRFVAMLRL